MFDLIAIDFLKIRFSICICINHNDIIFELRHTVMNDNHTIGLWNRSRTRAGECAVCFKLRRHKFLLHVAPIVNSRSQRRPQKFIDIDNSAGLDSAVCSKQTLEPNAIDTESLVCAVIVLWAIHNDTDIIRLKLKIIEALIITFNLRAGFCALRLLLPVFDLLLDMRYLIIVVLHMIQLINPSEHLAVIDGHDQIRKLFHRFLKREIKIPSASFELLGMYFIDKLLRCLLFQRIILLYFVIFANFSHNL